MSTTETTHRAKRAALFTRKNDSFDAKLLHDYADEHNYIVTGLFTSEEELLNNPKEDFEVILTTDTIRLPLAMQIIRVDL